VDPRDNPVWSALSGPHERFALRAGGAARYVPAVSPFAGLADPADPACWASLATLLGPGGTAVLAGVEKVPRGWELLRATPGVQLVHDSAEGAPEPDAVVLGAADVPEMLDLVGRTEPGPFAERTVELGRYVGLRVGERLVTMAGERLRLPGWTEISAVCTDPAFRGEGLAARLVQDVMAAIRARGDRPMLHAAKTNTGAIRIYRRLGFTHRREVLFAGVRAP
jgi:ribosomal protein S18 acetylase RimI-like enzyme